MGLFFNSKSPSEKADELVPTYLKLYEFRSTEDLIDMANGINLAIQMATPRQLSLPPAIDALAQLKAINQIVTSRRK